MPSRCVSQRTAWPSDTRIVSRTVGSASAVADETSNWPSTNQGTVACRTRDSPASSSSRRIARASSVSNTASPCRPVNAACSNRA